MKQHYIEFERHDPLLEHRKVKKVRLYLLSKVAVRVSEGRYAIGTARKINAASTQLGVLFPAGAPLKSVILTTEQLASGKQFAVPVHCYGAEHTLTEAKVKELLFKNPLKAPVLDGSHCDAHIQLTNVAVMDAITLLGYYVFEGKVRREDVPEVLTTPLAKAGDLANAFAHVKTKTNSPTPGPHQMLQFHVDRKSVNTVMGMFSIVGHELVHVYQLLHQTYKEVAVDNGGHGKTFFAWAPNFARNGLELSASTFTALPANGNKLPAPYYLAMFEYTYMNNGHKSKLLELRRIPLNALNTEKDLLNSGKSLVSALRGWVLRTDDEALVRSTVSGRATFDISKLDRILAASTVEAQQDNSNPASVKPRAASSDLHDGEGDSAPASEEDDGNYAAPPSAADPREVSVQLLRSKLLGLTRQFSDKYPHAKPLPVDVQVGKGRAQFFRITNNEKAALLAHFPAWAHNMLWHTAQDLYTKMSTSEQAVTVHDALMRELLIQMFAECAALAQVTDPNTAALLAVKHRAMQKTLEASFGFDLPTKA